MKSTAQSLATKLAVIVGMMSPLAHAVDIGPGQTYVGTVKAVAIGAQGQVGVSLQDGYTCKNIGYAILMKSNENYKDILALLYVAVSTQQPVKFYVLGSNTAPTGECRIDNAALGLFNGW